MAARSAGADLSALTAREVRDGIASKQFSAREITEAAFARIDAVDGEVHAFLELTPELAYEAADAIDANGRRRRAPPAACRASQQA